MPLKIHFYIRPQKANQKGDAPIYLRLTANGRKEYSIGYRINPNKWDKNAYRSKGKRPVDYQLNHHIESMIGALKRIETDLITNQQLVSAQTVLNTYLHKPANGDGATLVNMFETVLIQREKTIGMPDGVTKRTVIRYRTVLNHLKDFLYTFYGTQDKPLSELKYEFLENFALFLQTEKRIENNTRVKYITILRSIIRHALKTGKLQADPFLQWKGKKVVKERTRITLEELSLLREKELHSARLNQVRDVFVFSCYTGLAYIDVFNLTEENLIEEAARIYLKTYRQKTHTPCYIPLLEPALEILEKYEDSFERLRTGKLLPVKSNQKMNSYLKEIAGLCGIEKRLTFHVARHTFATTVLLANDVPLETVKELLGHKDITTTQHYAKMIQKKVDRDMDKLAAALEKQMKA